MKERNACVVLLVSACLLLPTGRANPEPAGRELSGRVSSSSTAIPARFCGRWIRLADSTETYPFRQPVTEADSALVSDDLEVSPDSIVWRRYAEGTEVVHAGSVQLARQGAELRFKAGKATGYIVVGAPGRAASIGRARVVLTVSGDTLHVSIGQARSKNVYPRGTMVVTVPPENQRYLRSK